MKGLAVPVDTWLRTQLSTIEKAVMMKVAIPADVPKSKEGAFVYRPLLLRDSLFLTVSNWCKYFKYDKSKRAYALLDDFEPFEKGYYKVNIEVSHVYIGPHKGGQNFSLSLRITQIMYKEEDIADDPLTRASSSKAVEESPQKKNKAEKRAKKIKTETPTKVTKTAS